MNDIARMIDHTLLKPEATPQQIVQLCEEARQYNFASVCINPAYVQIAVQLLIETPVVVCAPIGFPLGATTTAVKLFEAQQALRDGARELDMVLAIGALKAGELAYVRDEIQQIVAAARKPKALIKVILETSLLSEAEKESACRICVEAGADFVKTSTGFAGGGATVADVALMASFVAGKAQVKASGGIRTLADAQAMIAAGATRIGTSNSVAIIQEALEY